MCLAVLVLVLGALGAERAYAFCVPGEVQSCIVNGQPGTKTCGSNGMYGVCTPSVPPAPPVPATPTITGRTANSLTVRWTDPTMWSSASYQLQYQVGSTWALVSGIASSPAVIPHSGRQPDTKYCYRVEVTATTGVRRSNPICRYTTDGTTRKGTRVRLELHTGDVGDAGTDDDVQVVLSEPTSTGMNYTWLDYGRNDFERRDTFTYDLNLNQLGFLSDINRIRITKDGTNGWCLADFRLLVNEVPVYAENFHHLPGGCRWLDGDDGHQPTYEVAHATIRAHALWQGYVEPQRLDLDVSGLPLVTATLRIPQSETEQRIEGMIGHTIHGTEARWGHLYGRAYVEAGQGVTSDRVDMDLDLEADGLFDPEVDINFDLVYDPACSANQTQAVLGVVTENLPAEVDFDWFAELLSVLVLPPCAVANCVSRLEDYIAGEIEAGFEPIVQSQGQSLPAGSAA